MNAPSPNSRDCPQNPSPAAIVLPGYTGDIHMTNDFIKLTLKGQEYTFTALSFEQLDALEADFKNVDSLAKGAFPSVTQRASLVAICATSIREMHPDLKSEDVAKLLTLANISDALTAVAGRQPTATHATAEE
jgi:hypothetical protein